MCSGSVVVTDFDSESGRPGSNPEWGQYTMRLRTLLMAYPSLHPSGVVHWVPGQLSKNAVTGACKLIDGCSRALCSATVSVVSSGIYHRNKVKSTAWLYRDRQSYKIVSFTLHYITLRNITWSIEKIIIIIIIIICVSLWFLDEFKTSSYASNLFP